jgi:hypothetical protein
VPHNGWLSRSAPDRACAIRLDIDDWDDKPRPTSRKGTVCERELVYLVPFVTAIRNAGWRWHLVPIKSQE